ncbi:MAG: hypothetical protein HKN47_02655, partial [Pirellulaceae bacterium]|nr:hypothetical protein [Pirellulaceae bacterium]
MAQSSHRRMVKELRKVAAAADTDNYYFSKNRLIHFQKQLDAAKTRGDMFEYMRLSNELGAITMQLGDVTASLQHYQDTYALFEQINKQSPGSLPESAKHSLLYFMGVASLRQAEDDNCVNCRTGESCILPIQGTGVHKNRRGSEAAMNYFQEALEIDDSNTAAIWLLNLAAMTLG